MSKFIFTLICLKAAGADTADPQVELAISNEAHTALQARARSTGEERC
jgi:hypothetical protein